LNQILRRQTSRSDYGSKVPVVTATVFKYRNKIDIAENLLKVALSNTNQSINQPINQSIIG
jgi:hypothetical protein